MIGNVIDKQELADALIGALVSSGCDLNLYNKVAQIGEAVIFARKEGDRAFDVFVIHQAKGRSV